jgi:hypothetical protein
LAELKHILELAYGEFTPGDTKEPTTLVSDRIGEVYSRVLGSAGRNLWRGWLAVSASGFGKGMVLAAVALVALGAGMGAATLALPVEEGIMTGAAQAFGGLVSVPGLMILAGAGAVGAVAETWRTRSRITAGEAQAEAKHYEQLRQQAQEQRMEATAQEITAPSFREAELTRRKQTQPTIGR